MLSSEWVSVASLGTAILALLIAFLSKSPIVPSSRVVTLRETIADQGIQIANQSVEITRLTQAVERVTSELDRMRSRMEVVLGEREFYRIKWEEADRRLSRRPVTRAEKE